MAATTEEIQTITDTTLKVANDSGSIAEVKVNGENGMKVAVETTNVRVQVRDSTEKETSGELPKEEAKKEEVAAEVEPKTGISFPVKLDDKKQLLSVGMRKKSMLGISIKVYGFVDNEKLIGLQKSKIGKAPAKPTTEMYQVVIDSDVEIMVRLVIVYSNLTMSMVRKSFEQGLGASIKKLTGVKKNEQLANKVMGQASDDIKLTPGSLIEISQLPGHVLQTKVKGEAVSQLESELLCGAYINMYLGDDAFDKDAKEKFGMSLLSLF